MQNIKDGVTLTDRSGTITSGGTAQTVMAANPTRSFLLVQNVSDTNMWINFDATAAATQPSILLAPSGGAILCDAKVPLGSVSIICATTGKAFTAKEG